MADGAAVSDHPAPITVEDLDASTVENYRRIETMGIGLQLAARELAACLASLDAEVRSQLDIPELADDHPIWAASGSDRAHRALQLIADSVAES